MNRIKALLGFLSVFGVVAKFLPSIGGISAFFGPVGPMIAAVLTFFVQLVKWFVEGLTAMLAHPVTFVTASVFMVAAFLGGAKWSKEKYEAALARKDQVISKMISDGKKVDAAKKADLESAVAKAKAAVVAEEKAPEPAPADKPAPTKRVRQGGGKGLDQVGGPSVQWFQNVFGPGVKN